MEKKRHCIFIEDSLWRAARQNSLKYQDCPHLEIGSASWYAREAIKEKLLRDASTIKNLEGIDFSLAKKRT